MTSKTVELRIRGSAKFGVDKLIEQKLFWILMTPITERHTLQVSRVSSRNNNQIFFKMHERNSNNS